MVSRMDMTAVPTSAPLIEVAQLLSNFGFQRLPVYAESPDEVVGYIHVTDMAEESMFVREFEHTSQVVVIFVYTDDFEIAGPREEAILVHRHVAFLFGAGQEESYILSDFVGIQRSLVQRYADGLTHLFVHQAKYAAFTVEAYEVRFTVGQVRPLGQDGQEGRAGRDGFTDGGDVGDPGGVFFYQRMRRAQRDRSLGEKDGLGTGP